MAKSKSKSKGGMAPNFNQTGKKPAGRGGFPPVMKGGPKAGAKQKGFSK